jgi:hypothetical protein
MRFALASLTAAALSAIVAHAEKRLFILAGPGGYGIDNCLETGAACGHVVANSYCRSHNFAKAESFRNVGRDGITGADDSGGACG